MNKIIVSKSGKKFGLVGDLVFEVRTGELLYLLLRSPTTHATGLDLEKAKDGSLMIPFSSVISVADFVVVAEEDMV